MVFDLSGGISGEREIAFADIDADGGTAVTYAAVTEPLARQHSRRQLERTVRSLKRQPETGAPEPAE